MIRASVIISFYNNISILKLVLHALTVQSEKNFEVIIADDGSNLDVVSQIKEISLNYPFPIKHVWHEDIGFRKTRILNNAIINSSSDYLIFMDGDCIPHHHFVGDHLAFKKLNRIIAGRRVNISNKFKDEFSEAILFRKTPVKFFLRILIDSITGNSSHIEKGIHLPVKKISNLLGNYNKGVLGSNFSLPKQALENINGFDMRYEQPCVGEDTDIEYRLKFAGYEVFSPRFRIIQYHFIHKRLTRLEIVKNMKIFNETIANKVIKTPCGLAQMKDRKHSRNYCSKAL